MASNEDLFYKAAKAGDLPQLKQIYDKGVDIDHYNADYSCALFQAAYYNHLDCMAFLIEAGAKLDTQNSINCTPLIAAANKGHLKAVEILCDAGADITIKGGKDPARTAYDWAVSGGHLNVAAYLEKLLIKKYDKEQEASPREIVYFHQVADRHLHEIFNFEMMERVTYVRPRFNGPVEAVTRQTFDDIKNHPSLKKAFDEHVKRGGLAKEADVFGFAANSPFLRKQTP